MRHTQRETFVIADTFLYSCKVKDCAHHLSLVW